MLLKSSQTKSTCLVPELDLAVVGTGGKEFMFVEVNSLSFMDESLLVNDVALRFPLPDNDLAEGFESETDPCA
jgi:hypothetical protein